MTVLRGQCLCEQVRFELVPPTDFVAHCHCRSCRLSHGAAYVTWTSVPRDRFRLTAGAEQVQWYRSSPTIEWGFCSTCGSNMLYRAIAEGHPESPKPDRMYVTAASLLDPLDRAPMAHVSYEERLDWTCARDGLPKHQGKSDQLLPDG